MLSERAVRSYHLLIRFGCFLHLVPYKWDRESCQLLPASGKGLLWYKFHKIYIYCMAIFSYFRLIQTFHEGTDSDQKMENVAIVGWSAAYSFSIINTWNMDFLRIELMTMTNSILLHIRPTKKPLKPEELFWSRQVTMATILYGINPFGHAMAIIAAPCAPQFLSSIYFNCSDPTQRKPSFTLEHLPFFVQVYYDSTFLLYVWAFNGTTIFIGLLWILHELRKLESYKKVGLWKVDDARNIGGYRMAALLMKQLNHSMYYYLISFPTLLFTIMATVFYGTIRLWYLDFRANMIFPMCGARCGFEGLTILNTAGSGNAASKRILQDWRKWKGTKYEEAWKRSCKPIECGAGSMYTFENSIVPVSMDNLSQLMFNLLIIFE